MQQPVNMYNLYNSTKSTSLTSQTRSSQESRRVSAWLRRPIQLSSQSSVVVELVYIAISSTLTILCSTFDPSLLTAPHLCVKTNVNVKRRVFSRAYYRLLSMLSITERKRLWELDCLFLNVAGVIWWFKARPRTGQIYRKARKIRVACGTVVGRLRKS